MLRATKYNDDTTIVDIYTEAEGTVSFLVRNSRSPRAAVKTRLLRPMALLRIGWDKRTNARLQRLKSAEVDYAYTSLPYDPYKTSIALYFERRRSMIYW